MRILVHIHTWNDADVIGRALDAVMRQTRPADGIIIVDNGSTDGTASLTFPDGVTVLHRQLNLGPSGAVATGLEYGLANGYDWIWVLDADGVPRPDALEHLAQLAETRGAELGVVGALHNLVALGKLVQGRMLTPGGPRLPVVAEGRDVVECDSVIWCGALINLAVVGRVGLPRAGKQYWEDFCLDYGDVEYTYRIRHAGYQILVHRNSMVDQVIGQGLHRRLFGCDLYSTNHPPYRRYTYFRNLVFFWLKVYHRRHWFMLLVWFSYRLSSILAGILFLEHDRMRKIMACMVGIQDGVLGRLDRKYGATR